MWLTWLKIPTNLFSLFSATGGQSDACGAHVRDHLHGAGSDVCADGGGAVLRRGLLRGDEAVAVVDAVSLQGDCQQAKGA